MIITIIPSESIVRHLPRITELVEECRDLLHPFGTPADVVTDCIAGVLTCWGVFEERDGEEPYLLGALITLKRDYWRCSVLELITLSGSRMREWLPELNRITQNYAADLGCIFRIIPGGRKGWVRELAKYGWTQSSLITLECPVGQEGRRQQPE